MLMLTVEQSICTHHHKLLSPFYLIDLSNLFFLIKPLLFSEQSTYIFLLSLCTRVLYHDLWIFIHGSFLIVSAGEEDNKAAQRRIPRNLCADVHKLKEMSESDAYGDPVFGNGGGRVLMCKLAFFFLSFLSVELVSIF